MINEYSFGPVNILIKSDSEFIQDKTFNEFEKSLSHTADRNVWSIYLEHDNVVRYGEPDTNSLIYSGYDVLEYNSSFKFKWYLEHDLSKIINIEYDLKNKSIRLFAHSNLEPAFNSFGLLMSKINIESLCLLNDSLILHSSSIMNEECGILFTGPSRIGKSTQASLWESNSDYQQISGDRTGIYCMNDTWYGFGLPVDGKDKIFRNKRFKINAIISLKKADRYSINKLSKVEAYLKLYQQLSIHKWDENFIRLSSKLLNDLVENIPVYEFGCKNEAESVSVLREFLQI